ncbi:MAG: hypothetical protein F6K39_30740 [Okeania sp. SIO3B3]|nr:hypothetical protein [Okeania sp. SIO3B3]
MAFRALKKVRLFQFISCPVEYLHFGGGKAEGTYAGGRRKEKVIREKVFLSRYYPDMILFIGKGRLQGANYLIINY